MIIDHNVDRYRWSDSDQVSASCPCAQASCRLLSSQWSCVCDEGYVGDGQICFGSVEQVSDDRDVKQEVLLTTKPESDDLMVSGADGSA